MMTKLNLRGAGLLGAIALFVYACGGSSFSSEGGSSGSAGTAGSGANSGSSSSAGAASGGTSAAGAAAAGTAGTGGNGEAGAAEGGAPEGGTSSGGTSSAGTSSGGTSSAGAAGKGGATSKNSGDCTADTDCMGGTCQELYPGGFRTCVTPVVQQSTCAPACDTGSACVQTPVAPRCGGLITKPLTECVKEGCSTAADCTGNNAICIPAGALEHKVATCVTAGCRLDSDCKDEKGGKCEPVTTNCCDGPLNLYCVYPTKGCRSNADCATGSTCQVSGKTAVCTTGNNVCAG